MRRIIILATLMAMAYGVLPPGMQSEETQVIVVASSHAEPFVQTIGGFEKYLNGQGVSAQPAVILESGTQEADAALQRVRALHPQVVLTVGAAATERVIKELPGVPVVACLVLHAETLRQRPHMTGVGLEFPLQTQFEWIRRMLPRARAIGVLYNPAENQGMIDEAASVARTLGMRLEAQKVESPQDVPTALDNIARRADVIWAVPDRITLAPVIAKNILLFSFRQKIPVVGPSSTWVKAGALYALDWDYADLGAQCGELARQVLSGVPPADIPVAAPRKVQYSVNLATARQLRLPLSDEIARGAQMKY